MIYAKELIQVKVIRQVIGLMLKVATIGRPI